MVDPDRIFKEGRLCFVGIIECPHCGARFIDIFSPDYDSEEWDTEDSCEFYEQSFPAHMKRADLIQVMNRRELDRGTRVLRKRLFSINN